MKKNKTAWMMRSLTDLSDVALRHIFRFLDTNPLHAAEGGSVRLARVVRAATVELAAARFGIRLDPVPGCTWLLLVQEGLAGPGGSGLSVSYYHGLLVDRNGRVRSWGKGEAYGDTGWLGNGQTADVTAPQIIASLATVLVTCVSAGAVHSLAVTATGDLYSCGYNGFCQLGLWIYNTCVNVHDRVAIDGFVTTACAGHIHSAAITRGKGVFGRGGTMRRGNSGLATQKTAPSQRPYLLSEMRH